jgi:outer membrane biosynthesis protein TonB
MKIKNRTITSFEDFITKDLFPGMSQPLIQEPSDHLRLAISVSKTEPTYVSKNADCPQTIEELVSTWFRTGTHNHPANIFVVLVREAPPDEDEAPIPVLKEQEKTRPKKEKKPKIKKEIKKEVKKEPQVKTEQQLPVREVSRKRSFSDAHSEDPEDFDLLDPADLIANRTRNRHTLDKEDLECAAQYGPL